MVNMAKWYVVHTYSGYEKVVADNIKKIVESKNLQEYIKETKIPTEKFQEVKNGKNKKTERKMFPGYVIVKMILNDDTWLTIKRIKGVTGFVGNPYKPNCLTQKEVDELGIEKHSVEVDYNIGDIVKINSGAFKGFSGSVQAINKETGKVEVSVLMLGRTTSIEVGLEEIIL